MNLPNKLTVTRIILIPFFVLVLLTRCFGEIENRIIEESEKNNNKDLMQDGYYVDSEAIYIPLSAKIGTI